MAQHDVLRRRVASLEAALQEQRDAADRTTQQLRSELRAMEGERDDIIRQKDHECGALVDERDQLLVDTDARMLALTATDEQLRRRVHELESALAQAVADPVREKAEAAQLQALAAATEASEAALLRLRDKQDLLDELEAQTAQSNDLRRQLAEAEATSSTLYARLKTMSRSATTSCRRPTGRRRSILRKQPNLAHCATPRHVLEEIASPGGDQRPQSARRPRRRPWPRWRRSTGSRRRPRSGARRPDRAVGRRAGGPLRALLRRRDERDQL